MDSYKNLKDDILEVSKGDVVMKKNNKIIPAISLFAGVLIIMYGSSWSLNLGYKSVSYLFLVIGAALAVYGFFRLIFGSTIYYYVPTGAKLHKKVFYLQPEKKEKVLSLLEDKNLSEVLCFTTDVNSSLMFDYWYTPKHDVIFCQLCEYRGFEIKPITEPKYIR
ncbi:MAG: hypothetical protein Q4F97_09290 [Bacteroidales bacterium]|nr:hypothetical protein [Bacteroidales bacterium]